MKPTLPRVCAVCLIPFRARSIRAWAPRGAMQSAKRSRQDLAVALFALCVLFVAVAPSAALAGAWPLLAHPHDAQVESIGERVRLNGVPMHLTRVITTLPTEAATAHYRGALGTPVAHAQTGDTQVLTQARGDFFITVSTAVLALHHQHIGRGSHDGQHGNDGHDDDQLLAFGRSRCNRGGIGIG